jgi:methylase of polypeptide subunit release factors
MRLDARAWRSSCVHTECTLHQIAPYIGKLKSTIARALIERFSRRGETIFDPFVGSGTVALEAAIAGRRVVCADINPYAVLLTRAKLTAPPTAKEAEEIATKCYQEAVMEAKFIDLRKVPLWIRVFFHPKTLKETLALARVLSKRKDHFLLGCLLGVLHHQRPGFLSFPASHLVPYLRTRRFPRELHPEMYEYRPVLPRLVAKIRRSYRRIPRHHSSGCWRCIRGDGSRSRLPGGSVDAIVTSPPYMNALDYYRDNRLRLWFTGMTELPSVEPARTRAEFTRLMRRMLRTAAHVLRPGGYCVFVIGDLDRNQKTIRTSDIVCDILTQIPALKKVTSFSDFIPDVRRARRHCTLTKREVFLVLQKTV